MPDETPHDRPHHQHQDRDIVHHPAQEHYEHHPRPAPEQKKPEPSGADLDASDDDDEHTDSKHHRSHGGGHRGGRPVKKVYEEWANDPYCE